MLSVVRHLARTFTDPLLDFLFPRVCFNCQQLLPDGETYVCEPCWKSIERVHEEHPLFLETKVKLLEAGYVGDLVSCFLFQTEGVIQLLAHAMKYEGFEQLGVWLGRELGKRIQESNIRADYLIPIPLHKRKYRERGYNQAELIARGVSDITQIPVRVDLVQRCRFTETQTKLNLEQRQKNVEDAFELVRVNESVLSGKVFLLVDDVITTGATLSSCAGELVAGGASKVIAASLALAQ